MVTMGETIVNILPAIVFPLILHLLVLVMVSVYHQTTALVLKGILDLIAVFLFVLERASILALVMVHVLLLIIVLVVMDMKE